MSVKVFYGVRHAVVMICSSILFPEARRRGETFCFRKFASFFLFPLVCLLLGLAPEAGAEMPVVSFSSRYSSGTEGDSSKGIRINISPPPASDMMTIYYKTENRGDATLYRDFFLLHPGADGSIDVTPGSNDATIYVVIEDDSEYEIYEELFLALRGGDDYKVGKPSTHRFVIFDNDDPPPTPPEIGIASGNAVTEGSGVTFILYSVPAPANEIRVNVKVSENGAFAASGETGQRKVLVGTGGRGEFTVKTDNDNVDEPNGSITATVITGNGYSPDKNSYSVSVGVKDNDDSTLTEDDNRDEENEEGEEKMDKNEESSDREELLEIYRATEGPTWTENENWDTDKPISEWHGVSVDENSMVTGLYLDGNGLSGEFPVSELSTMTELRELALWDNEGLEKVPDNEKIDRAVLRTLYEDNGGSEIRNWFPKDEKTDYFSYSNWDGVTVNESGRITGLDLSDNSGLTGELPLGLMGLSELTHLDISGTMLCPPENKAFEEWLGKLAVFTGNVACDGIKRSGAGCAISSVSGGPDQSNGVSFALAVFALTAAVLLGSSGRISKYRALPSELSPKLRN